MLEQIKKLKQNVKRGPLYLYLKVRDKSQLSPFQVTSGAFKWLILFAASKRLTGINSAKVEGAHLSSLLN